MDGRPVKDALFGHLAQIGGALANAKRVELLDLLAQGERSVEALAAAAAMSVGNASAQLKVLREASLVAGRREGKRVMYRVTDDAVLMLTDALRRVARRRSADVERLVRDYVEARDELEPVSRDELVARSRSDAVVVVDVRPPEEYRAGHIAGALSIPLPELEDRLAELDDGIEIVAYCRGPFCLFAPEAIDVLRRHGRRARRLEDGFPEWRLRGLPVTTGDAP